MYLGNPSMTDCESTYYLPLLQLMEEEGKENGDTTLIDKLESLKKLPQIKIGSKDDHIGLPPKAISLITKGCYKLIYTHLEDEKYGIILHDVQNDVRDEVGRAIPFMVMFMSDSEKDLPKMNKLAIFLAANMKTASVQLGKFFCYDPQVNGLRFEIRKMNQWLNSILINDSTILLHANGKSIEVRATSNNIGLLVVRRGISVNNALSILSANTSYNNTWQTKIRNYATDVLTFINGQYIVVPEDCIQPHDNPEEALANVNTWNIRREKQIKDFVVKGSVFIAAILIIYCMTRCGE